MDKWLKKLYSYLRTKKRVVGRRNVGFLFLSISKRDNYVILPVNFNPNVHVRNFPPEQNGFESSLRFNVDKMKHFLGLLSSIPANNKNLRIQNGFVPIYSKKIDEYFKDYLQYIKYLINSNVIERSEYYSEGKSYGYRWKEPYRSAKFDKVLMPKSLEGQNVSPVADDSLNEYPYLKYWCEQKKLRIDARAKEYALSIKNKKMLQGEGSWDINNEGEKKDPIVQYTAIMNNLCAIEMHDYKAHIVPSVHRLYSVLTSMQSEYRNFLTYDGKKLVSIDVKNCQSYITCSLLNPDFWKEDSALPLSLGSLPQNIQESIRFTPRNGEDSIIIMLGKFLEDAPLISFNDYKDLVSSGRIYESLMEWYQQKGHTITRDEAKLAIFYIVFSSNKRDPRDNKYWQKELFEEKFPNVAEVFRIIKTPFKGEEKKQHKRLAYLIQAIESKIMLHRCCKRIWEEKGDTIPIFTIHDSIVTTEEHANYVKSVVEQEFTTCIGVAPSLEVETWDISNLDQSILEEISRESVDPPTN